MAALNEGCSISELLVGLNKGQHSVAVAESGRDGEVRSHGAISSEPSGVRRLARKLERPGVRLRFCYEAARRPTG